MKLLLAILLAAITLPAAAQDFPVKPLHVVIPFPPGGATDTITRRIGERLTQKWGQPVIVENKPGANTVIGTEAVHRADADGYTLLMTSPAGLVQLPPLMPNLPYNPERDFMPLTQIAEVPTALVVPIQVPAGNVKELADYLNANKGKTAYGSLGLGSTLHIYGEAFRRQIGADTVHVPYKGDAPAMTDLFGGRIQYLFNNPVSAIGAAKGGKVRILAVTGEHRLPAIPDVPTMREAGYPGFEVVGWFAFFVRSQTPQPIAEKLHAALSEIIRSPDMADFLRERGTLPTGIGLAEFAGKVRDERKVWAQLIKENDIRLE